MAQTQRQRSGNDAERWACDYLQNRGLHCVTRNYRCRAGELDLVMQEGDQLVFVEVRYRAWRRFGGALESVGPQKRRRLVAAALHYLQQHQLYEMQPTRFDVVCITHDGPTPEIEWIPDAFAA